MLGTNPILPLKKGDGNFLDVQEIFATFQGEGLFTGYPAIFVRLGGCNLACKFCDTEFDSYREIALTKIIAEIEKLAKEKKEQKKKKGKRIYNLVVISGGEPMRQEIAPLCRQLIAKNFAVQIETNGTLYRKLPKEVVIICSPKANSGAYHPLRADLLKRISAFKFLISAQNKNYQKIPELGQSQFNITVYLQPIDELDEKKNQANRALTIKLAQDNGCRISLQTHKIWKIR